jgi:hypothetical protein
MKAKPLSVANPRTTAQVENRDAFKLCTQFASIILASLIIPLMNRFAKGMSGYNMFVSLNKVNFDDEGIATQANINFGTGKLGDTPITAVSGDASDDTITIQYSSALNNQFKQDTDKPYVMIVDSTNDEVMFAGEPGDSSTRTNGQSLVEGAFDVIAGRTYWVYLIFLRADGTVVGNTAYSTVVPAA